MTGISINTEDDCINAAKLLFKRTHAPIIVMKLGNKGAMLYEQVNGNIKFFPAIQVNAVDTTAAGDVFTAAMAKHYIQNDDIEDAIHWEIDCTNKGEVQYGDEYIEWCLAYDGDAIYVNE